MPKRLGVGENVGKAIMKYPEITISLLKPFSWFIGQKRLSLILYFYTSLFLPFSVRGNESKKSNEPETTVSAKTKEPPPPSIFEQKNNIKETKTVNEKKRELILESSFVTYTDGTQIRYPLRIWSTDEFPFEMVFTEHYEKISWKYEKKGLKAVEQEKEIKLKEFFETHPYFNPHEKLAQMNLSFSIATESDFNSNSLCPKQALHARARIHSLWKYRGLSRLIGNKEQEWFQKWLNICVHFSIIRKDPIDL